MCLLNDTAQQKHVTIGKLNLVDLAGSERVRKQARLVTLQTVIY